MKRMNKLYGLGAAAVLTLGLSACTNELNEKDLNNVDSTPAGVLSLVKTPDVIAWSGNQTLGNTFAGQNSVPGTRTNAGNGDLGNQTWISKGANDLKNITNEERDAVLAAIEEKVTGQRISEDVVFPWTDYFLQDVISAQSNYGGAGSNGNPSASYKFEAWNTGADCRIESQWYTDFNHPGDYNNYECVSNSAHINSFFQKENPDKSQEKIEETALMTDMQYGTYEEMKGKQFRWYINCHENLHWYEYIVVKVDNSYYICFDFACGHKENDVEGNSGKGSTQNDWDYNDWILKITPAGNQPDVWTGDTPTEQPEEGDNCDKCEHPSHEGKNCDQCEEGTVCNPQTDTPETEKGITTSEVEVNLSILDEHDYDIADLVTKLSIHVRAATDVEVTIPVPKKYYVEVDDMYIFNEHYDGVNGGAPETYEITYVIEGHSVKLTIEFNNENIVVRTDGITNEVFEYCKEYYGDGINFEIYNYYNNVLVDDEGELILDEEGKVQSSDLDREKLRGFLNLSTIEFLDSCPDYYINAFNEVEGAMNDGDCTVSIVEEHETTFDKAEGCWHINNSVYNVIYKNKSVENSDETFQHDHIFLWGTEKDSTDTEK